MQSKHIAIIGAGISGLSLARFLSPELEVEVLEKTSTVGGLIKCEYVFDNLFHKVGGHVFNAKSKAVSNWFWAHFDLEKEFYSAKRNAKILLGEQLIGYPVENHLYELNEDLTANILADLLDIQTGAGGSPLAYDNFEDFLKGNFGRTLYKLYFQPYNQKIWHTDLSQLPLDWLAGKLPMPDIRQILLSNIIRQPESTMVHATFFYPKEGGSQFIANRLAEGVRVRTNFEVSSIRPQNGRLLINQAMEVGMLVYTGDVRKLADLIHTKDSDLRSALSAVRDLKSSGTSNLFCECDESDLSWLYLPESATRAHRIIYTGNFSPANNRGSRRKTCVVEFSGYVAPEVMKEEIRRLPGQLSALSSNYEPNSYIIQGKDTRQKISILKEQLHKYRIHLVGRFAEWEYYNMDKAIEASQMLADQILYSEL